MTITYKKAVRDKIPEIIENSGKKCIVQKLTDEDYLLELEKKLHEEITEYLSSRELEELADVFEVIYRILQLRNVSVEEMESIRSEKFLKRGGFEQNYFLLEVRDIE